MMHMQNQQPQERHNDPVSTLHHSDEADVINLLDLVKVVVENLRLLVFGSLLVGFVALAISFIVTPTFTATTRIIPPQQQASGAASLLQSIGALGSIAGVAGGIKNPADQYVAFLKSRSLRDALIERFKLQERYEVKLRDDARKGLDSRVRVSSGKDGLITIEVDDHDAAFAAELANAHVEELGTLLKRLAVTEAQQRRVFFEKQLSSTKDNLTRAEQVLKATGINGDALKADPKAAVEGVARLRASITAQEVKLASMRGYLADTAPAFKQAQNELAALRAQLERAQVDEVSGGAHKPRAAGGDYVQAYREFKYQETLFELFAKQYEIARIDEAREGAVIQVVDVGVAPERRSSPKRALMAIISTLASFFVLLLFVFVRQSFRVASQDPQTASKFSQLRRAWRSAIGR